MADWNEDQPIYRQIREKIVELILNGTIQEGEPVPSVRSLAADYQINHLTVSKAYQGLVAESVLEKKRGLGMFVTQGAQAQLLVQERKKFLEQDLPMLIVKIKQLGFSAEQIKEHIEKWEGLK